MPAKFFLKKIWTLILILCINSLFLGQQCCKAFGISQYNVFICLVDYWILLGISWGSSISPRLSSALLVRPLIQIVHISIIIHYLLNISLVIYSSFGKSADIFLFYLNTFDRIYMLCRLCIIFLGFDVFFVVFCVALACIIGIAVCCCLPCIIALLYAVADQVSHV